MKSQPSVLPLDHGDLKADREKKNKTYFTGCSVLILYTLIDWYDNNNDL